MKKIGLLRALLFCITINTFLFAKPIDNNIYQKINGKAIVDCLGKVGSFILNNLRELGLFASAIILYKNVTSLDKKIDMTNMPKEDKNQLKKEATKLLLNPFEFGKIKDYFEEIFSLPWGITTTDNYDIKHAKQILDEDHYGLEKIKEQILDFIALRSLSKDDHAPILCFVGPPGTGKTSLGKSIARSLGRKYARIALGGISDESEIRGFSRTYVGSMPGRIIKTMKKVYSDNPVIVLDEIDKITSQSSHNGNPAAAMLEVLDPEQNKRFHDKYLEIPYDLSQVMFIATANDINAIPRPLRDRMKIIKVTGYTCSEKIRIAQQHLVKKALEESGLVGLNSQITDAVLEKLITGYTRESGVRELKRIIKTLCVKIARGIIENSKLISLSPKDLEKHLGPQLFTEEGLNRKNKIGVVNGLAVTETGGTMLKVEAALLPGFGEKLILTGQLGDVMKESAQIALSYVKAHAKQFGIDDSIFFTHDLHIHFPEGATPKDGPSAGISMLTAIISAFTGQAVDAAYAMTGEINLCGEVMPIGGVKEKILAAKRNNISHIILPKQNERDLIEIKDITKDLDVILVSHVDEVLKRVLLPKGA